MLRPQTKQKGWQGMAAVEVWGVEEGGALPRRRSGDFFRAVSQEDIVLEFPGHGRILDGVVEWQVNNKTEKAVGRD